MPLEVGMKMYRFEDGEPGTLGLDPFPGITIRIFKIMKITPCGCWVQEADVRYQWNRWNQDNRVFIEGPLFGERKFILQGNGKRFCYPTLELAKYSYSRRKAIHIDNLEYRLDRAKAGLETVSQNTFIPTLIRYLDGGNTI